MKSRVLAVGLPGVGKTTVLNEFKARAEQGGIAVRQVNYGSIMLELSREVIKDRDEIRRAPLEVQQDLQRRAAEAIDRLAAQEGVTLIDTHMMIKTGSGFFPGIPSHVLAILKPDIIALITAPAADILKRRASDPARWRGDFGMDEKAVAEELEVSQAMACACAVLCGAPLAIVVNREGEARRAAEELYRMVTS